MERVVLTAENYRAFADTLQQSYKFLRMYNFLLRIYMKVLFAFLLFTTGALSTVQAQTINPVQPSGSGTAEDPYLIATFDHLTWLMATTTALDKHYKQVADIDASPTESWIIGDVRGWIPIALGSQFTGTYDGNGKQIIELFMSRPNESGQNGLFGIIGPGGEVKNLTLTRARMNGGNVVGAVAGDNYGLISGVIVSGEVIGSTPDNNGFSNTGGVAGRNQSTGEIRGSHSSATTFGSGFQTGGLVGTNRGGLIRHSSASGAVSSSSVNRVGGLAGNNAGFIQFSYATGEIKTGGSQVGGLVGRNTGIIEASFATGNVFGIDYVGGLVGLLEEDPASGIQARIAASYSTSAVYATNHVGGLLGGGVGNGGRVEYSYASGFVSGTGANVGGFAGNNRISGGARNYWNSEISEQSASAFGNPLTTAQMRDPANFQDWDFTNPLYWQIQNGVYQSFPYIGAITYDVPSGPNTFKAEFPGVILAEGSMILEFTIPIFATDRTVSLPLFGTVNAQVDWGDGTLERITTTGMHEHTYKTDGTYTVRISGTVTAFGKWDETYPGVNRLTRVIDFGELGTIRFYSAFKGAVNLVDVPSTLPSTAKEIQGMFNDAITFNDPDVIRWDLSNITNMGLLFGGATAFNQDISGWDVSNVTGFGAVFRDAKAFNQNISTWDVSNGDYMFEMFNGATSFAQDLGGWDISKVTNMTRMLDGTALSREQYSATLVGWAAKAPVQNGVSLGADGLKYDETAVEARALLTGTYGWTISDGGFLPAKKSMVLEFVIPETATDKTISLPFFGTVNAQVDWGDGTQETITTTGKHEHTYVSGGTYTVRISGTVTTFGKWTETYPGADKLTRVLDFGELGTTQFTSAFQGATNLTDVPATLPATATTIQGMFTEAVKFNDADVSGWDVSNVTSIARLFKGASAFNRDISGWDVSNVTGFGLVFQDATAFNQNIGGWNVSSGTYMVDMFNGASKFNQNLGGWDISKVTNMTRMLDGTALSREHYSATLVGWAAKAPVQNGVSLGADGLKYDETAVEARALLTGTYGWTISDGGYEFDEIAFGVTHVTPLSSIAGKPIALFGAEFGSVPSNVSITFKHAVTGQTVTTVNPSSIVNGTRLNVQTPNIAGGNYKIQVSVNGKSYTYPKIFTVITQGRVFEKRAQYFGAKFAILEVQDLNGDGHYDILVQGVKDIFLNRQTRYLLGDGNFGFTRQEALENVFIPLAAGDITTGDADRDGDLDILQSGGTSDVANTNARTRLWINTGGATYQQRADVPFVNVTGGSSDFIDLDMDGDLDALITGKDNSGQWAGNFATYRYQKGSYSSLNIASMYNLRLSDTDLGDLDGDGDLDILYSGYIDTYSGRSGWLLNQGINPDTQNPYFTPYFRSGLGLTSAVVRSVDVDMDGNPELFFSGSVNDDNIPRTYLFKWGNSDLTTLLQRNNAAYSADFGDYDADGDQDLLIDFTSNYQFDLFRNDGGQSWVNTSEQTGLYAFKTGYRGAVRFADLDGDGDLDIVATGVRSDSDFGITYIYENKPFRGGDGSSASPYEIHTLDDLRYLSENSQFWGNHFKLVTYIDASETAGWNGGMGFSPIGTKATPFTGSFHGQNYVISGLTVADNSLEYAGLFGVLDGTVKNLGLKNVSVTGADHAGALAGRSSSLVSVVYSTGSISADLTAGGLIANCEGCRVVSSISGASVSSVAAGGVVGGLVGRANTGELRNVYADGTVSAVAFAGGLIGASASTTIQTSYAGVMITDSDPSTPSGAIIGGDDSVNGSTLSGVYFSKERAGVAIAVGTKNTSYPEAAFSETQMIWSDLFQGTGWDFTNIWTIQAGTNRSYPYLRAFTYNDIDAVVSNLAIPGLRKATAPMVLTINTALVENVTSFDLPLKGDSVDVRVDWGDGRVSFYEDAGEKRHEYGADGTRTIQIFGRLDAFSPSSALSYPILSAPMITDVTHFGELGLTSLSSAFSGAVNITSIPPELPASVTSLAAAFAGATSFNGDVSEWDVSAVTDMRNLFRGASTFNQDLGGWKMLNVTNVSGMLENTALSTANYDALLTGWAAQQVQQGLTLDATPATYSGNGETARQTLIDSFGWTINDGGLADVTAPAIVRVTPKDDSVGVSTSSKLRIEFSEAVTSGQGNIRIHRASDDEAWEITPSNAITVTGAGTSSIEIMPINGLRDLTSYYVLVDSGAFVDADGNAFQGMTSKSAWNFTTADETAPRMTGITPADGSSNVSRMPNLAIRFSETVKLVDAQGISIVNLSTLQSLETNSVHNSGADSIMITPKDSLMAATSYAVQISASAIADLYGNAFAGITDTTRWNFITLDDSNDGGGDGGGDSGGGTQDPVTISSVIPAHQAANVSTRERFTIQYSNSVKAGSGAIRVYKTTAPGTPGELVEEISVNGDQLSGLGTQTIQLTLQNRLDEQSYHYITIEEGAFIDQANQAVAGISPFAWSFRTADETAPTLREFNPTAGATGVPTSTSLRFSFSEPVAVESGEISIWNLAKDTLIEVQSLTGNRVSKVDETTFEAYLETRLAQSTSYYVLISENSFKDQAGNVFGGLTRKDTWTFTTADESAPVLRSLSPANGQQNVSLQPALTLQFNKSIEPGSGNLTLFRASDNAQIFQVPTVSAASYNGTSVVFSLPEGLTEQTQYYVLLDPGSIIDTQGNAFGGITDPSAWTFTTASVENLTLESVSPETGTIDVSLTPTLTMTFSREISAIQGAIQILHKELDSVVIQVPQNSEWIQGFGTTSVVISLQDSLQELTEYAVLVDSDAIVDNTGNTFYGIPSPDIWTFTTANDPSNDLPETVQLLSPANQSIDQSLLTELKWSQDSLATSYQVQLSEQGLVAGSLLDREISDTSLVILQGLDYATTYEWHVRAINKNGESEWSRMFSFRTQQEPIGTTRLTRPENGAEDIATQPTFEWQAVQGAEWYDLQLSKRSNFSIITLEVNAIDKNQYTLTSELDPGTVYYWRVRSGNDGKISDWSTPHMFQTQGTATTIEDFSGLPGEVSLLQNYPNPFNPSTQIRFGLPQASHHLTLAVYSMTGQQVASIYQGARLQAGWHEVTFRADHLPSGTYMILLRTGAVQQTRLLTLIK